ncbi:RWD domain-containing protein [Neurospora intermedia]|uniref:RBR-type E3 ubiquitin transferase n=1 Tax=Neurospora intermedia TaxID=5142 RepID=A0ABR3D1G1_NEUIN
MASFNYDDSDSPRDTELSSLIAIYPEIQHPRSDDPYAMAIDVPVNPSKPVLVYFPAAADSNPDPRAQGNFQQNGASHINGSASGGPSNGTDRVGGAGSAEGAGAGAGALDRHEVAHLPPVHLEIIFGPGYPAEKPPVITISADPPWLSKDTIKRLEDDGPRLWEEMGRDMVGFTYIDHIQQAAENVFELVDEKGTLEVDPQHRIAIMDYDIRARRAAFEKETFNCMVCLDPKKGSVCHKMIDCGHVFCVECLQDYYNNAIKEGDLASVRCLAPNCTKEREKAAASSSGNKKRKKPKTYISPSELLQIPLDPETVKRYVTLKYKTELESDKNTIYCPRQWCNGAARSKKHKKPQGLELNDHDEDEEEEEETSGVSKPYNATDLLAICEDCNFAFCSRCHQSWHGEFVRCQAPRKNEELTAEEIASLEYMKLHTTPCPTCAAPAQKTHGCNHMICYRCQTHFCYLCSAWLDPGNPYQHFNEMPGGRITGCYQRLWELEQGDGDDVGLGFEGGAGAAPPGAGRAGPAAAAAAAAAADAPEAPPGFEGLPEQRLMELLMADFGESDDEEDDLGGPPPFGDRELDRQLAQRIEAEAQNGAGRGVGEVAIAREGPLVLRIDGGGGRNQPVAGRGRGGGAAGGAAAAAPNGPAAGGGRGGRGRGDNARGGQGAGGANIRGQHQNRGGAPNNRHNNRNNHPNHNGVGAGAARGGRNGGGVGGAVRGNVGGRARPNPNGPRMDFDNPDNVQVNVPDGIRLDPQQEAWIRQFVHLALEDQEDLLFDDDW